MAWFDRSARTIFLWDFIVSFLVAMRYFFAPELELFLTTEGFDLVRLGAFPDLDDEPSEQTWNVAFVARAR